MMVFRNFSVFLPMSVILLTLALFEGCGTYGQVILEDERGSVILDKGFGHGYYENTSPNIPPGHMSPQGNLLFSVALELIH